MAIIAQTDLSMIVVVTQSTDTHGSKKSSVQVTFKFNTKGILHIHRISMNQTSAVLMAVKIHSGTLRDNVLRSWSSVLLLIFHGIWL